MTGTTANGITYPTGSDALYLAVSTIIQQLAQNVDDIVLAPWTAYTPAWTGATANPVIGNGTRVGAYRQRGKTVDFRAFVTFGSTTTYGTGAWSLSLPVPPKAGLDDVCVGAGLIKRAGTRKGRTVSIDSAAGATVRAYEAGAVGGAVASGSEAWAAADFFSVAGTYERS